MIMTNLLNYDEVQKKVAELQNNSTNNKTIEEITEIVTAVISSLSGGLTVSDLKFYKELEELVKFMQDAKKEIASIWSDEIPVLQIPIATDELDAVVMATEEATTKILDAAEKIEGVIGTVSEEQANILSEATTKIYEASNFQDITGQRITKVIKTMRYIEQKVFDLLEVLDDNVREKMSSKKVIPSANNSSTRHLMNGPGLPGEAQDQHSIDALFDKI